ARVLLVFGAGAAARAAGAAGGARARAGVGRSDRGPGAGAVRRGGAYGQAVPVAERVAGNGRPRVSGGGGGGAADPPAVHQSVTEAEGGVANPGATPPLREPKPS